MYPRFAKKGYSFDIFPIHKSNAELFALANFVRNFCGIFFLAHDVFAAKSRRLRLRIYLGRRERRELRANAFRLGGGRNSPARRISQRHFPINGIALLHVGRKDFRAWAIAIFYLARQARFRHS